MRYGSIYVVTNTQTKEQYVGQTTQSVFRRWSAHKSSAKKPKFKFAHAIARYGSGMFECIEWYIAFNKSELDYAEKLVINEINPVYNLTRGGAGKPDKVITQKQRSITARLSKARWADPVWKANTVKAMWGNDEVRERRIHNLKLTLTKPEVIVKYQNAQKGRKMQATAIAKSSKAKWKPVYCPETHTTYLSQKAAAEMLGALTTSVANAVKNKGKVNSKYTLIRVT